MSLTSIALIATALASSNEVFNAKADKSADFWKLAASLSMLSLSSSITAILSSAAILIRSIMRSQRSWNR